MIWNESFVVRAAGSAHFEIAEVHPFADYNGRAARLFATAIFYREGFLSRPLFSPERYYAEDKAAYYEALRAIKRTHNLTQWLAYFVEGLASEFERVAEKVRSLAAVTRELSLPYQLSSAQEQAIAMLTTEDRRSLTVAEFAERAQIGVRTASRDLNNLVDAGVLRASGKTRDRVFRLAGTSRGSGGRPRVWTEERVERELSDLVNRIGHWPSYRDFQEHHLLPLYAAMQRTGGASRWAEALGVSQG